MLRVLALILSCLLLSPATAQEANLSFPAEAGRGAASQLALAHRVFRLAGETGDPVLLLAAIRLARGVITRPALGWVRIREVDPTPLEGLEQKGPVDPGNAEALAVLRGLAIDDPNLQDLAYDLGAQMPQAQMSVATIAEGGVRAENQDDWRVPLSGSVAAEIALIGDGGGPVGLTIVDDTGAVICARPPSLEPALCSFTPARNGFFMVQVKNAGAAWNSYQLIGN